MSNVLVIGSLNFDLSMQVNRLPKIGETIHGRSIDYFIGGKGANQAVAASRIINDVSLIGCLGNDTFGEKIKKHLKNENLNINNIETVSYTFTGMASIFKTEFDNAIVVIPGANDWVSETFIDKYEEQIKNAKVLLLQLEIPISSVLHIIKIAKKYKTTVILNPAPYHDLSDEIINNVDFITPNDSEFSDLCGSHFDYSEIETQMLDWQSKHPNTQLIVTRGSQGVSFVRNNTIVTVKAFKATVVDTTGAGDTFNGILAAKISQNTTLDEAITWANAGASLSVQKFGAQTGMPTYEEVNKLIKNYEVE
ncbi:ribokinase [Clostridium sp. MSJ-4]|uniref:Ribokinase n=1 Tax=Clostridium simiarum TaxID=2841506 RepID=A0ABS6F297_9CLOT|nr:ribokinase [Clostridium simiarum]MBU5592624.1 ribokinase [Clostridium simiarum]